MLRSKVAVLRTHPDTIFDDKLSMSKRLYDLHYLGYFKGKKAKHRWGCHIVSMLIDLHDHHYHMTSEYKAMDNFFDSIEHLRPKHIKPKEYFIKKRY